MNSYERDTVFNKLINKLCEYRSKVKDVALNTKDQENLYKQIEEVSVDIDQLVESYKMYKNGLLSYNDLRTYINKI
jgi:hypothetical protein